VWLGIEAGERGTPGLLRSSRSRSRKLQPFIVFMTKQRSRHRWLWWAARAHWGAEARACVPPYLRTKAKQADPPGA